MTVMSQIYQFGPFRLDAQRGELTRGGVPVALGGRALRVLAALLARPGQLVTKDELMQAGWPGMFIEEGNIATQIRNLRQVLGDEETARQLIVTVAGRGYRFAGDVARPAAAPASHALPLPPQAAREELILGRERELATLHAAVTRHRLVTVTGAGGIGKTRLAAEFAAELSADATGRLIFLPLEDVRQEGQVASRLAALLGVAAGAEPERAALAALRPRAHFLVFDNCEHLLAEMAALTDRILTAAPRVKILATSREALGVAGEFLLRLEPLALPDQHVPAALTRDYPAIKLFEAAAQEAGAGFAVTAGNAAEVLDICRRLEGMPLALRLAGGRLAGGSLADLASSLSASWRLPASAGARLPARQRSMEATIAWSVALLSTAEREFFIRLGVFPTSFAAAAAAALAPSGVDAAATLAALAAKSLVVAVATAGPVPRYRLLEPLRDFARRQITPAEERFCRMKLLDYFSDFCDQAKRDYRFMSTAEWLPRYGDDHETVEDLLQWAIFGPGAGLDGVAAAAIHLNYAAGPLRVETRERVDVERWNQAFLALLTDDTTALLRAKTLAVLTTGINEIGALRYAEQVREAAGIFRQLGERAAQGMALMALGAMMLRPDNIAEAENVTREAAAHLRAAGEARHLATCIGTLAVCRSMAGDLPGAEEKLAECLRLAQQAGCQRIIREARAFQVGLAIEAGRQREAIRLAQAQIAVCRASGGPAVESYLLLKLSAAHLLCGEPTSSLAAIGEAMMCYSGNYLADFATQAAAALAPDGGAEHACRLLGFAEARRRQMGMGLIGSPENMFDETARRTAAEVLGEAACARLRAEGALWDDEETIECLRAVAAGTQMP